MSLSAMLEGTRSLLWLAERVCQPISGRAGRQAGRQADGRAGRQANGRGGGQPHCLLKWLWLSSFFLSLQAIVFFPTDGQQGFAYRFYMNTVATAPTEPDWPDFTSPMSQPYFFTLPVAG